MWVIARPTARIPRPTRQPRPPPQVRVPRPLSHLRHGPTFRKPVPTASPVPTCRTPHPSRITRFPSITRLGSARPRNGPEPVTGTPDGSGEWWERGGRGFPPPTRRSDGGEIRGSSGGVIGTPVRSLSPGGRQ